MLSKDDKIKIIEVVNRIKNETTLKNVEASEIIDYLVSDKGFTYVSSYLDKVHKLENQVVSKKDSFNIVKKLYDNVITFERVKK